MIDGSFKTTAAERRQQAQRAAGNTSGSEYNGTEKGDAWNTSPFSWLVNKLSASWKRQDRLRRPRASGAQQEVQR